MQNNEECYFYADHTDACQCVSVSVLMTCINTHHLGLCASDIQNRIKVVLDLQLGLKTPMSTVRS